jgi:hypothetical protein
MKQLYFLLSFVFLGSIHAQLNPSIGLSSKPADTDSICDAPWYLGSFYASGFQTGNTVPDFKLYGLSGDSLTLSTALASGKPALLIAGSLTCPVFRNKVSTINQVVATYSSLVNVYIIYTLEAHPTDTSVYFGTVNVTSYNTSAGILFPQPKTYGERKKMVDTMYTWVNPTAPVFIDGPCNEWWSAFGPAPNNAYIINTNGVVVSKHGWFHKSPDDIFCDLDSILNVNKGLCSGTSTPGTFTVNVLNAYANGKPGAILYDYAEIINISPDPVTVKTKKIQTILPVNWMTAFCADVCYTTVDDSIQFSVAPYDTLLFSLDFFTDMVADSGRVKVGFRNAGKNNNSFSVWLRASTVEEPEVGILEESTFVTSLKCYPNPARDIITISCEEKQYAINVYDALGRQIYASKNDPVIKTGNWERGLYFAVLSNGTRKYSCKIILTE